MEIEMTAKGVADAYRRYKEFDEPGLDIGFTEEQWGWCLETRSVGTTYVHGFFYPSSIEELVERIWPEGNLAEVAEALVTEVRQLRQRTKIRNRQLRGVRRELRNHR